MKNKVYYGEYTLSHWIDLMLKGNIKLPEYQRYFVWEESKVRELIEALNKNEFVPSVTIGSFKNNDKNENFILDGQQRLTSILLAYLGIFPDKTVYKKIIQKLANENDDYEEDVDSFDNILEWKFDKLLEKGNSKEKILKGIVEGNYKKMDIEIEEDFFGTTFLGFSYLVPHVSHENTQQKYYSTVFRNINIRGEALLPQESRASLYYLDKDLLHFFEPVFINNFNVKVNKVNSKPDFVRYISMLSQYFKQGNSSNIAKGFKSNMEKYYETYIYSVVADSDSEIYGKFTNIFPNKKFSEKLNALKINLEQINVPTDFDSIIDVDMYFFGIIYLVLFKNKNVAIDRKNILNPKLEDSIKKFREDKDYSRAPNNLGNLRSRISKSIEIYEEFEA